MSLSPVSTKLNFQVIFFVFLLLQINLWNGLPSTFYKETCTSGAGTVLLEFGILSRLLGDPTFENSARKAIASLWKQRSMETGLLGGLMSLMYVWTLSDLLVI